MERDLRRLNIGTIGDLQDGRPGRQFEAAWANVLSAIQDPESKRTGEWAKGTITITLSVEGKTQDEGGSVGVTVDIAHKTPPAKSSGIILTQIGHGDYAADLTPKQTRIPGMNRPRVVGQE